MKQIIRMERNMVLRIPNGRRRASWLFYKLGPEDLNSGLPRTNPASGHGGTWTRALRNNGKHKFISATSKEESYKVKITFHLTAEVSPFVI